MTRRICLAAMALGVCSLYASAQSPGARSADRSFGMESMSAGLVASGPSHAAAALLSKRVETVDWLDMPFEEVVSWLKTEGEDQVNIVPRWGPLSVESVDRDTLVTLQLNNSTVAEVLNEVMDQLSDTGALAYQATGNKLRVSTKTDFDRKMYVRVYDATDILFRVPNFGQGAPQIDLQRTSGGGAGGGGGGGQSVFGGGSGGSEQDEGGKQAEQDLLERLETLRTLIEETVAPETWDTGDVGGRGRIRVFNRSLVIVNTIEIHEMIAGRFSFGG